MGRRRNPKQASLFKAEIPEMPEGYYSSGPNPNLRRFVEEHATHYDPDNDSYEVPAFDKPIKAKKTSAVYNMHSYHQGKKPSDAIVQYIEHYTNPGDIVLDPFCGSGSTALAALMKNRAAIAVDLSPAATFITKNYCTAIDPTILNNVSEEINRRLNPIIDWLYGTRCDRCDGSATTIYTVYSYVFQCPRCLEKIPYFDCARTKGETAKGKTKKIKVCPHCLELGHIEEISTRGERFDPIPVQIGYSCLDGCQGQFERYYRDSDSKKREYFKKYDLGKILEIEDKDIPYWYPRVRMMHVESDSEPWGDKWRAGTSNFRTTTELYTKRNLWALAAYYDEAKKVQDSKIRDTILFSINAISLAMSRMQGYVQDPRFPNQLMRGTYYLPQISREYNVAIWQSGKIKNLLSGYRKILQEKPGSQILISTQSATELQSVPSGSIDFIFTDPPYSNNVQYGELNFIWEAWLGFDTRWHEKEIIVNKTRNKTEEDWAHLMKQAMGGCFRVLKPGRWLSLAYHDTSEGTWQLVQDIMAEIGFIPEHSEKALYIDTEQKSFNQLMAEKVTKRDLVINFHKPRPGELRYLLTLSGDEGQSTFTQKARGIIAESLEKHPGSSADRLYDELVSRMVRKGEFERHNFAEILRSVAEDVDGRWYLLETAGHVDAAEGAKEEAAAARLENFMHAYLAENPGEEGVHFSNLFEQNLFVKDMPRRDLKEWLPEYFFRTEAGTWRPPDNEEERKQKAALRASGTLRRVRRFVNALSEGVPPHKRDIPANIASAADWIRQCRRAGLYEQGRALYEKGGFTFDSLGEEARMQVEEDYQICMRRSG